MPDTAAWLAYASVVRALSASRSHDVFIAQPPFAHYFDAIVEIGVNGDDSANPAVYRPLGQYDARNHACSSASPFAPPASIPIRRIGACARDPQRSCCTIDKHDELPSSYLRPHEPDVYSGQSIAYRPRSRMEKSPIVFLTALGQKPTFLDIWTISALSLKANITPMQL